MLLIILVIAGITGLLYFNFHTKSQEKINSSDEIKYAWTQYGPDSSLSARVITTADDCPLIKIDGHDFKMDLRAAKDNGVDVATCEKNLPLDVKEVLVGENKLPVANWSPKKILVIGDTGCKVKGKDDQDCDDPDGWVLPELAKKAAEINPDLIIHVGDFIYREGECEEEKDCGGSPWGYNLKTLETDFFNPAKPLLSKAPWLFVRGNHEECSRGGPLWFRFQGSSEYNGQCSLQDHSYTVNFKNLQLLNIDTSIFYDYLVDQARVDQTVKELGELELKNNFWLVSHRPLWGVKVFEKKDLTEKDLSVKLPEDYEFLLLKYKNELSPKQKLVWFNHTLQNSLNQKQLDMIDLSLSGHYHNFEALSFKGKLPPQMIAGNTATELEADITETLEGLMMHKEEIADAKFVKAFGYMVLKEVGLNNWRGIEYSPDGEVLFECDIKNREVICKE